jgi:DNA primase
VTPEQVHFSKFFAVGIDRNELLAAIDTAQVFSNELNQPIKDLKWQSLLCPFHEDSEPSFRILLPDGGFNCLGCGESGGSVIDLTMKLHNLDFPTAINYLATNYTTIRQ